MDRDKIMGKPSSQQFFQTALQHIGLASFDADGTAPVPLPSQRSSTVRFKNVAALEQAQQSRAHGGQTPPVYGRGGVDTPRAPEEVVCSLEQAQGAILPPRRVAAISHASLTLLLQRGSPVPSACD